MIHPTKGPPGYHPLEEERPQRLSLELGDNLQARDQISHCSSEREALIPKNQLHASLPACRLGCQDLSLIYAEFASENSDFIGCGDIFISHSGSN